MKFTHLNRVLDDLKKDNAFRNARTLTINGYTAKTSEHALINFSSNDYLGLAGNTDLQRLFFEQADVCKANWMSASSSRPLTGTSSAHTHLETLIAGSYGKSSALLYNSGYHANTGILPAITSRQDLVLADKFVHASLIDGLKLGDAKFKRFAHNNVDHLAQLLTKYRYDYRDVWIITESVFSMDGDRAPLSELVSLKNQFQCSLYVDEAHAVGCFGSKGLGLTEELNLVDQVDLIVGTFGKALAGCGGYVVGDQVLIDSMINFSRSWLFSTAIPPINIEWNVFVWQQLATLQAERKKLTELTGFFKSGLENCELAYLGQSHIVPVIEAGNENVVALAHKLEECGVLAMPIRSPTVAAGSERIRFSLNANMPISALSHCLDSLNGL
ncbi:8-amino-7-oxononanoate synthase [Arenicella sp.]|nr:8-amino-7-oxononanoate synthase [Arenicella sp.]